MFFDHAFVGSYTACVQEDGEPNITIKLKPREKIIFTQNIPLLKTLLNQKQFSHQTGFYQLFLHDCLCGNHAGTIDDVWHDH
jgi:hypothetical protein